MKRREFIMGSVVATPFAARAQTSAMPVIGWLHAGGTEPTTEGMAEIRRSLAEQGFVEGRNVHSEIRSTTQYERLPDMARDMARAGYSVIITLGTANAAVAMKAATVTTPIVFVMGGDPVDLGLVASLNRPGGNVTGVTFLSSALMAKRLELLREMVPRAGDIGYLVNPDNSRTAIDTRETFEAARNLGQRVTVLQAAGETEISTAFEAAAGNGLGAIIIGADAFFYSRQAWIAELATRRGLPTSFTNRVAVQAGGLMSYGSLRSESYRQAGEYAGRILKGDKPANLPVVQPSKFEFVINLKTAKALGLAVPQTLLVFANEVIE